MRTSSLQFLGASLALSFLSVSSVVAASMSPKLEPLSVFMKGGDLEWSSMHAYGKASTDDHREYHKNAEAERVLWSKENALHMGSSEYSHAFRAFVQKRNLMHRQWHLEKSDWVQPDAVMQDASMKFFDAELTISLPEPSVDIVDREYDGVRVSRRSLVNQVLKQQKLHSLTVGQ